MLCQENFRQGGPMKMFNRRIPVVALAMMVMLLLLLGATTGTVGVLAQDKGPGTAEFKTMDDQLAEIAGDVPGFGGMFLDPQDNSILYTYLLDPSQKEEAEQAISRVFGPDVTAGREVRVLQGQYSIGQLKAWYDPMYKAVLALPGVTATDLDEGNNRLWVGLEKAEAQAAVEAELDRLGIPRQVVTIEVEGPLIEEGHDLQSKFGIMEAGIQIHNANANEICTLGFNTERSGERGIVTVHHCTPRLGDGADFSVFHQNTAPGNRIGIETIDTHFFTSAQNPSCPGGRKCRLSDSAFIKLDANINFIRGAIARPFAGTIDIDHNNPKFRIISDTDPALVGHTVNKVGKTTGWTLGMVTQTCVPQNVNPNLTYLCMNRASYTSAGGDSGAPVFRKVDSPQSGDVKIYGIHLGVLEGTSTRVFSPIGNIYADLGQSSTWNTCDTAFAC
jgi:hypothetical protein